MFMLGTVVLLLGYTMFYWGILAATSNGAYHPSFGQCLGFTIAADTSAASGDSGSFHGGIGHKQVPGATGFGQ